MYQLSIARIINIFDYTLLYDCGLLLFKLIVMQAIELLQSYMVDANTWDEMYKDAHVREQYKKALQFLQQLSIEELNKKEELAKRLFMSHGITFTVYSSGEGIEKIFPFDIIPPIITKDGATAAVIFKGVYKLKT